MKKLSKIRLRDIGDIMSEKEMKLTVGGYGTCAAYLPNPPSNFYTGNYTGSSIEASEYSHSPSAAIWRGISKEEALSITQGIPGAKWCCDNCSSASWY